MSRTSRPPPGRVISCWTRSSASPSSRSQWRWSATARSVRAIVSSSDSPPASSSATTARSWANASSKDRPSTAPRVPLAAAAVASAQSSSGVLVVLGQAGRCGRATSIPTATPTTRTTATIATKTTRSLTRSPRRRGQLALRDPDRQPGAGAARPPGRRTIAPSRGAADDRVAAVERRLGPSTASAEALAVSVAARSEPARGAAAGRRPPVGPQRRAASLDRALRDPDRSIQEQPDALAIRDELGPRVQPVERPPLDGQLAPDRVEGPADGGGGPIPGPAERRRATPPGPARRAPRRRTASRPGRPRRSRRASRRPRGRRRVTTGRRWATTARTTRSSLNDQRSSSEPPPRARIVSWGASAARPSRSRRRQPSLQPPERPDDALRRVVALDLARRRGARASSASAGRGPSRCRARRRRSGS